MSYFPRVARGVHSYPRDDSDPAPLGLGVVGLHEGRTALLAAYRTRGVRPVAGCDLDAATRAAVAAEAPEVAMTASYADLLARDDVAIVGVYTPDHLHAEHIVAAFEAGKDVVCTKPIVNDAAAARAVLAAARRTGRRLLVGQSTRFFESFRRQRAAFERGEVGDVEVVEAHYTHRMDWYYDRAPWIVDGTDWVYLGLSHPLDLLRWYLGPVATVSAVGSRSALAREHGCASYDIYSVNATTADGRLGRVFGHYGTHELPRARNSIECLLYGSAGTSMAQYHDMRYLHTAPDGTEVVEDMLYEYRHFHFNNEVHGMHYGEFANYLQHFADALTSGTPHSPDLVEGIETFCLMEAVRRSARAGGASVEVADLRTQVGL
ncbi:Gfo/Idh/MocA family oxidoreductase [Asanoa sp. WMMD1127]|uniref:Gfo/Idh/MocA family protein n=1 Tax=Asanoa sp. WMMD1127 TaxID=3016107 RepID=UPI00241628A3|nr:Gfo/Idh/MocA family oxidoreductase [Asanoa sp. WMMD1127]MDG4825727.1 Gfo/Idh/MocA family oxidoreductase [Asanoa sp. WMMD1127]